VKLLKDRHIDNRTDRRPLKYNLVGGDQQCEQGLQSVLRGAGVEECHPVIRILRVPQLHQQFVTARRESAARINKHTLCRL